jgi:hypothetical protein
MDGQPALRIQAYFNGFHAFFSIVPASIGKPNRSLTTVILTLALKFDQYPQTKLESHVFSKSVYNCSSLDLTADFHKSKVLRMGLNGSLFKLMPFPFGAAGTISVSPAST